MIFDKIPYILVWPPIELGGAGFILETKPPHNIGRVLRFQNKEQEYHKVKEQHPEYGSIEGYAILIKPDGALSSEQGKDIRVVLQEMAMYYYELRIEPKPGAFSRERL